MRNFHDKIFDNDYNTNNIKFEYYGDDIVIDKEFQYERHGQYENFEYIKKIDLEQKLYEFTNKINKKLLKLRCRKETLPEFIEHFYEFYNNNQDPVLYNNIDFVTIFCEFFNIDYKSFFNSLLPNTKLDILNFLNEKYDITNKNEFYNIF